MKSYSEFSIEIPFGRQSGNVKTLCPHCHATRHNHRDKSLSVNLDKGIWNCHYCGWKGSLHVGERRQSPAKKTYKRPAPVSNTILMPDTIKWFLGRGISEETLKEAKVTDGPHFMPQVGHETQTMHFNYYLNGELINVKYRTPNKDFALESGAELIPYNLDAITGQKECIITEGEMDCLSFIECGHPNCISVPNGANANLSYLDDFIDGWFEDKQTIYIAVDTDQKGIQLRDELIRRFGAERCKILTYGDDCKDANEVLMRHGRQALEKCLANAEEIRTEGIFSVSDFEEHLDDIFAHGMPRGLEIGIPNFDRLCRFETKRIAIVTGIPGSGKSEFMDQIAINMSLTHGWRFGVFSPENCPFAYHASKLIEKTVGKRFQAQTMTREEYSTAKSFVDSNFYFIDPKDDYNVDTILEKAGYLVRRFGIKGLIIDPFNRLDLDFATNKETDEIRNILRKLIDFAQRNDILIFLVAHPKKCSTDKDGLIMPPTLYDIAGSAHFYNMADYGIIVHRDRVNDCVEIKIQKVRFQHLGNVGAAKMKYNINNGRYSPLEDGQAVNWDNTNRLSAKPTPQFTDDIAEMSALFDVKPHILQHWEM